MGSGSAFDYKNKNPRILAYVLFSPEAELVNYSSMHLAAFHGIADSNVGTDPTLGFKTFGGSIITGYITTKNDGMSMTNVVPGTQKRKSDNSIISSVFEKDGKLFVKTESGIDEELIEFPSINDPLNLKLKN